VLQDVRLDEARPVRTHCVRLEILDGMNFKDELVIPELVSK